MIFENIEEGNVSDIVNDELVETSVKFKSTILIWEKVNLIYYYFNKQLFTKNGIENSLNLFIFRKNDKHWAGFISGTGYRFTEKIYIK